MYHSIYVYVYVDVGVDVGLHVCAYAFMHRVYGLWHMAAARKRSICGYLGGSGVDASNLQCVLPGGERASDLPKPEIQERTLNPVEFLQHRFQAYSLPRAPNIPLLRALWSLLDGTWGVLKGSWGVLVKTGFFGSTVS